MAKYEDEDESSEAGGISREDVLAEVSEQIRQ